MKYNFIFTLAAALLLNCSNTDDDNTFTSIQGQWQWEHSSGGFTGENLTPENTGEQRRLIITADSIKTYVNQTLSYKSAYSIAKKTSVLYNDTRTMIIDDNGSKSIITLEANNLKLTHDCFDCFTDVYVRE